MALGDGTMCKTCFECPRMVLCGPWKKLFFSSQKLIWFGVIPTLFNWFFLWNLPFRCNSSNKSCNIRKTIISRRLEQRNLFRAHTNQHCWTFTIKFYVFALVKRRPNSINMNCQGHSWDWMKAALKIEWGSVENGRRLGSVSTGNWQHQSGCFIHLLLDLDSQNKNIEDGYRAF